ncbi:MAG: linear amide C-N hydrolase [Candidatus Eisenbacteria bacterium]
MRPPAGAALFCLLLICSQIGPSRACTSFCLDTPDGPVFAANLDLFLGEGLVFVNRRGIAKENIRQSTTGETAKWVSEYGSVTFNLAGRGFAWGGMNEAGLVVSSMELRASEYPEPDERAPFDSGSWIQYVLDTCGSVREAIQIDSIVRLHDDEHSPTPFLVADADGDCAAFEYLDGRFVCYTDESLPVKALANAPYAAGIAFMEQGVIPAENPGRSVERVAAAANKIESFRPDRGVSPVDYSLGVLTETVVAPKSFWSDWFDEPYTRWNVVFDIGRREAHFRTVASPTVRRLSLRSFDLSCEAPLLMMDVNAELEGDVQRSFTPYDHDVNLEVFRTFCDKWGIEVSAEGAIELMRFFESFRCAR